MRKKALGPDRPGVCEWGPLLLNPLVRDALRGAAALHKPGLEVPITSPSATDARPPAETQSVGQPTQQGADQASSSDEEERVIAEARCAVRGAVGESTTNPTLLEAVRTLTVPAGFGPDWSIHQGAAEDGEADQYTFKCCNEKGYFLTVFRVSAAMDELEVIKSVSKLRPRRAG